MGFPTFGLLLYLIWGTHLQGISTWIPSLSSQSRNPVPLKSLNKRILYRAHTGSLGVDRGSIKVFP